MSVSIFSFLTEAQARDVLGVLPLRLPAAAAPDTNVVKQALAALASPGFEELPEWAQARTPRPADDVEQPQPAIRCLEVLTLQAPAPPEYDVCHDCGAMHLPTDNHSHDEAAEDEGEGEASEDEGEE